jgi:protein-tyrosine-phosphatase
MTTSEALETIKSLLFTENKPEQKFAMVEGKLVDGTIVNYDLETGVIFTIGADGADVPAPIGEHELESGDIVVVLEEGKIAEVKKKEVEDESKVEIEVEAAKEEVVIEDVQPKIEEKMSAMEEKYSALEEKVAEMSKKLEEMTSKSEKMSEAVRLSTEVIESIAKDPSDKAIQKPNNFSKELKDEKEERFNKLQKAFQNLKTK